MSSKVPDQDSATEHKDTNQYVAFQLGATTLLSSLTCLDEIVDVMPLNPVPGTTRWFLGLGAQKGQLLPVSDFGQYVGGDASIQHPESRLLIINSGGERIGLAVDEVLGLVNAEASDTIAQNEQLPGRLQPLLVDQLALDGRDVSLINLAGLLAQPDFLAISETVSEVSA